MISVGICRVPASLVSLHDRHTHTNQLCQTLMKPKTYKWPSGNSVPNAAYFEDRGHGSMRFRMSQTLLKPNTIKRPSPKRPTLKTEDTKY